jgi:hypothetical protein
MSYQLSGPRSDRDGLDALAPLWIELHQHHLSVSEYRALVQDLATSWQRRLNWYRLLLERGACYFTANDDRDRLIGYAMLAIETGPDDTFEQNEAQRRSSRSL